MEFTLQDHCTKLAKENIASETPTPMQSTEGYNFYFVESPPSDLVMLNIVMLNKLTVAVEAISVGNAWKSMYNVLLLIETFVLTAVKQILLLCLTLELNFKFSTFKFIVSTSSWGVLGLVNYDQ